MLMNMVWMTWITGFFQQSLKNSKVVRWVLTTIATAVGEEAGTLEEVYEPFLIQEGFLKRTPRGREATQKAYEHLRKNSSDERSWSSKSLL